MGDGTGRRDSYLWGALDVGLRRKAISVWTRFPTERRALVAQREQPCTSKPHAYPYTNISEACTRSGAQNCAPQRAGTLVTETSVKNTPVGHPRGTGADNIYHLRPYLLRQVKRTLAST